MVLYYYFYFIYFNCYFSRHIRSVDPFLRRRPFRSEYGCTRPRGARDTLTTPYSRPHPPPRPRPPPPPPRPRKTRAGVVVVFGASVVASGARRSRDDHVGRGHEHRYGGGHREEREYVQAHAVDHHGRELPVVGRLLVLFVLA